MGNGEQDTAPSLNTTQDIQVLMKNGNKAAMRRLRSIGDGLDGNQCIAKPVFEAHADTQEQTFKNQELLAQIMLRRQNGAGLGKNGMPRNPWALIWMILLHPAAWRAAAVLGGIALIFFLLHVHGYIDIPWLPRPGP